MRPSAREAACSFVGERFPECSAAILAGSVVRGDATATSDLDLVVLGELPGAPFRASNFAFRWPVEVFAHTEESLRRYFASDVRRRRPSLPRMCAEGVLLRDRDGRGAVAKAEAVALLAAGPPPLTPDELAWRRYALTDALDDLTGSEEPAETAFVAADVAVLAAELILLCRGRWLGRGKWLHRELAALDAGVADEFADALSMVQGGGMADGLVRLAEAALTEAGGPLFEGYRARG